MDDRERLLRTVSEAAFTQQVVELARINGWLCTHARPGLTVRGGWVTAISGAPGLPDLLLVRHPRVIFAELKRQQGGVLSEGQRAWLSELGQCPGVETYIWAPGDRDEIFRILAA